jgi:subtilisin family serine protease
MTLEQGDRIYNNDYADLLIAYSGDETVFNAFQDATVQVIDGFFAAVRVPVVQITDNTIAQLGYSVYPSVFGIVSELSIEASGINKIRNIPSLNLRGQGVLIGILDTGIDYTNPVFRNADNTTRIAAIWDQTIANDDFTSNTYFGMEYTREQINEALQSENPFDIVPSRDENGHGTMLAGIAAGNEVPESGFYGVAPEAELVVVKLKPAKQYLKEFWKIPGDAIAYSEIDLLFAMEYLEQVAIRLNRPMAICIAVGTSQGAHDERGSLTSNISTRAENLTFGIVVAAGNEGNARRHYSGNIDPSVGYDTVELNVGSDSANFTMEVWGNKPGLFAIDIKSPSGELIPRILPRMKESREVSFVFERTRIFINFEIVESQSGEQLILLRFTNANSGIWTFKIYGSGDLALSFNIWLPMENFISDDIFFLEPDPYVTILSIGNGIVPITVTAYNPDNNSLYLNASKGYTRTGIIKPDIAAPGVNIISPTNNQGFAEVTGTSPAAAHTAGVVAMILEWAVVRGNLPNINSADIKVLMIRGAKRDTAIRYPNREWGYGILDVFGIFNRLRSGNER